MSEKIVLDSMAEVAPEASCTISIMMEKPCQFLHIEPNPELEEWSILDIRVGHTPQVISEAGVPAVIFGNDNCMDSMDICLNGQTFSLQVHNSSDIPRRFKFNLIVEPLTV